MTPIPQSIVVTNGWLTRRMFLCALAGVAIGFSGVIGAMQYVEQPYPDSERILDSACRLGPEIGSFSWWHRKAEGIECGRYR